MRESHIVYLLDERSLGSLSKAELELIKAHTAECSDCLRAYEAARASMRLLQGRRSATIEPPPFFQTKVMAAIRERNLTLQQSGFGNLWQMAKPLVASMGVFVALLLALTLLSDSPLWPESREVASFNDDAPEWVIVDNDSPEKMTYGQALTVLYEPDDPAVNAGDTDGK